MRVTPQETIVPGTPGGTMQEAWRFYRDMVYPRGLPALQNKECHQAYFAGAMDLLLKIQWIGDLPEKEALLELNKLEREVLEINAQRAHMANPGREAGNPALS